MTGRDAYVFNWGQKSKIRQLKNGVPQGSVTSPNLFVLATHDVPIHQDVKIITYADDIAILVKHENYRRAAEIAQNYLQDLEGWLNRNRMRVAPQKSTLTFFTSDYH